MICPIHKAEMQERFGCGWECPRCCNYWPDALAREHQPKAARPRAVVVAESLAKRVATLKAKRRVIEDAMVAWLAQRTREGLGRSVRNASDRAYYHKAPWPISQTACSRWLKRLAAEGRVEQRDDGLWYAKEG